MVEVEVKVSIKNRNLIEEKLSLAGFEKGELLRETDHYFDSDHHNLKKNDMALRIRSCENLTSGLTENFMTYKGPKMDAVSMMRKELEMQIEDAEIGKEILKSLGYVPVRPVIKLRQQFYLDQMTACLDLVSHLGEFLELEIVVSKEDEKDAALNRIISLLRELGYEPEEIIRTSYLSMLQNNKNL